jgi:hypothetical protein
MLGRRNKVLASSGLTQSTNLERHYSDGEKQTHALFNRSGVFLAPKHAKFVSRFIQHASKKDSYRA